MSRPGKFLLFLFPLLAFTAARAQYELPNEIFERTLLIRNDKVMATAQIRSPWAGLSGDDSKVGKRLAVEERDCSSLA